MIYYFQVHLTIATNLKRQWNNSNQFDKEFYMEQNNTCTNSHRRSLTVKLNKP